jgi:AraC family transcriptional regulator
MEPQIETCPAFTVVGMRYRGKNENQEVTQLWGQFVQRIPEIRHRDPGGPTYGVMYDYDEATGEFTYVAALPVNEAADLPKGMVSVEIPDARYAVFECTLPTLGETYAQIHEWLPQSGYEHAATPEYEYYGPAFNPEDPGSTMSIYIPLK